MSSLDRFRHRATRRRAVVARLRAVLARLRPLGPRGALLALCLVASGCTTASQVSTRYYEISGSTGRDLDREIRRKGPDRGRAVAMAGISFRPVDLEPTVRGGLCRFQRARLRVNAAITLPRWREAASSPDAALRRNWSGLAAYARAHEEVHVRIAEAFARELERALVAIPPQPSCGRLELIAAELVRRALPLHRKAQLAFDAREQRRFAQLAAAGERRERAARASRRTP